MIRSFAPVVLLLLSLAACDGEEAAPPAAEGRDLRGLYTLRATAAGPIPVPLGSRSGCTFTAEAGHLSLLARNRFEAMLVRSRRCETPAAGTDTVFMDQGRGVYTTAGDSLRFQFQNGGIAGLGSIRGDTLTVAGPGQTMRYVRDPALSEELLATDSAQ